MSNQEIKNRLEELRAALRAENISYGELSELQDLAEHIEPGDVELLEPAGVPESEAYTPRTEIITRVPRVGEMVRVKNEDWGDAGLSLPVGTVGTVTKADYETVTDDGDKDFTFFVDIDGGATENHEGGWNILAEYGKLGSDYFDGKGTLEAFWHIFESLSNH